MLSLGGGLPNPASFPLASIRVELRDHTELELSGAPLAAALQYTSSYGLPTLITAWRRLHAHVHDVPDDEALWSTMVGGGSQMLVKPTHAFLFVSFFQNHSLTFTHMYTHVLHTHIHTSILHVLK